MDVSFDNPDGTSRKEDVFQCFMGTELDLVVVGNFILKKEQQDSSLAEDYRNKHELD